ncbi:DUF6279 family lipoprotein [Ideonella sp. BN130291]|uniref:DUF6279 family lipoprotein n=1 Tax=Ideonella sp. BN130291 TaxID=3112940 RepID=UPI002E264BC2|nr:DUF6279 family lipoprotein [Ideonella sp. BN130291]
MQGSLFRRWIIGAAMVMLALVAGCSVALKITYNQGPTLLYWWMDGYVDFDDDQAPRVRQLIDQWFQWNRQDQLPDYAQLLQRAQTQVLDPVLTPQAMCGMAQEVKRRTMLAYDHAVPSLAEVALTLTPEQLKHLEKKFEKNNAKYRDEFMGPRREDRIKANVKKAVERFELVYGSVDDAQHQRIVQAVSASPYDPELWLAERRLVQQEVLQALRQLQAAKAARAEPAALLGQAQAALRQVAQHVEQSPREAYRPQQQRVWDYNCAFAAQVHNTMSPAQRQYAQRKLKRWEDDVRALNAAPR